MDEAANRESYGRWKFVRKSEIETERRRKRDKTFLRALRCEEDAKFSLEKQGTESTHREPEERETETLGRKEKKTLDA